jgi:hypothetical protein
MRFKTYLIAFFILFCCALKLLAQSQPAAPVWNVQAYGFATRYHNGIGYEPGIGAGWSVGHHLWKKWLSCAANFEYTRATQTLRLIDGADETGANIYQSFLSLRGRWQAKKQPVAVFANLLGGCSLFRPQALAIDAGTLGRVTLHPKHETKFVLAWSSGVEFRIIEAMSVLFSIRQSFSRFAIRQIDITPTQMKWRPYWNYGAGLSWAF